MTKMCYRPPALVLQNNLTLSFTAILCANPVSVSSRQTFFFFKPAEVSIIYKGSSAHCCHSADEDSEAQMGPSGSQQIRATSNVFMKADVKLVHPTDTCLTLEPERKRLKWKIRCVRCGAMVALAQVLFSAKQHC